MAKKKVSDTLAQQRKARESFLELKKIQSGEIEAGPKPSEMEITPKTFSEKTSNFWFHFKWHVLASIFAAVTLTVLIVQCAGKPKYDMHVVYFTYTPVMDEQTALVSNYLEPLCSDLNGDGEVNISVINCSMSKKASDTQYSQSAITRLQSIVAAGDDTLLYITDSDSAEYFSNKAFTNFFGTEQVALSDDFYKACKSENFGELPQGLRIACRRVEGTTIEKSSKAAAIYDECLKILDKLQAK